MSVFEKIAFLESFFKVFEIDQHVQLHSEVEMDYLINCLLYTSDAADD